MKILMAINDNYVEQAIVLFESLAENNSSKMEIIILDTDLSVKSKKMIKKVLSGYGYDLNYVFVDKKLFLNAPQRDNISVETYFRLLAFDLLPDVEKILYLDADIVVNDSIEELWDLDMENYCIAGVADQGTVQSDMYHKINLRLKKKSIYINGGVLLMNLKKIREKISVKMVLNYIEKMGNKLKYQDQDVVNVLFEKDIYYLPMKYNCTPIYKNCRDFINFYFNHGDREKPKIIHYMGEMKPWNDYYGYKYFMEYERYCRKTKCRILKKKIWQNRMKRPISIVCQYYKETLIGKLTIRCLCKCKRKWQLLRRIE